MQSAIHGSENIDFKDSIHSNNLHILCACLACIIVLFLFFILESIYFQLIDKNHKGSRNLINILLKKFFIITIIALFARSLTVQPILKALSVLLLNNGYIIKHSNFSSSRLTEHARSIVLAHLDYIYYSIYVCYFGYLFVILCVHWFASREFDQFSEIEHLPLRTIRLLSTKYLDNRYSGNVRQKVEKILMFLSIRQISLYGPHLNLYLPRPISHFSAVLRGDKKEKKAGSIRVEKMEMGLGAIEQKEKRGERRRRKTIIDNGEKSDTQLFKGEEGESCFFKRDEFVDKLSNISLVEYLRERHRIHLRQFANLSSSSLLGACFLLLFCSFLISFYLDENLPSTSLSDSSAATDNESTGTYDQLEQKCRSRIIATIIALFVFQGAILFVRRRLVNRFTKSLSTPQDTAKYFVQLFQSHNVVLPMRSPLNSPLRTLPAQPSPSTLHPAASPASPIPGISSPVPPRTLSPLLIPLPSPLVPPLERHDSMEFSFLSEAEKAPVRPVSPRSTLISIQPNPPRLAELHPLYLALPPPSIDDSILPGNPIVSRTTHYKIRWLSCPLQGKKERKEERKEMSGLIQFIFGLFNGKSHKKRLFNSPWILKKNFKKKYYPTEALNLYQVLLVLFIVSLNISLFLLDRLLHTSELHEGSCLSILHLAFSLLLAILWIPSLHYFHSLESSVGDNLDVDLLHSLLLRQERERFDAFKYMLFGMKTLAVARWDIHETSRQLRRNVCLRASFFLPPYWRSSLNLTFQQYSYSQRLIKNNLESQYSFLQKTMHSYSIDSSARRIGERESQKEERRETSRIGNIVEAIQETKDTAESSNSEEKENYSEDFRKHSKDAAEKNTDIDTILRRNLRRGNGMERRGDSLQTDLLVSRESTDDYTPSQNIRIRTRNSSVEEETEGEKSPECSKEYKKKKGPRFYSLARLWCWSQRRRKRAAVAERENVEKKVVDPKKQSFDKFFFRNTSSLFSSIVDADLIETSKGKEEYFFNLEKKSMNKNISAIVFSANLANKENTPVNAQALSLPENDSLLHPNVEGSLFCTAKSTTRMIKPRKNSSKEMDKQNTKVVTAQTKPEGEGKVGLISEEDLLIPTRKGERYIWVSSAVELFSELFPRHSNDYVRRFVQEKIYSLFGENLIYLSHDQYIILTVSMVHNLNGGESLEDFHKAYNMAECQVYREKLGADIPYIENCNDMEGWHFISYYALGVMNETMKDAVLIWRLFAESLIGSVRDSVDETQSVDWQTISSEEGLFLPSKLEVSIELIVQLLWQEYSWNEYASLRVHLSDVLSFFDEFNRFSNVKNPLPQPVMTLTLNQFISFVQHIETIKL